MDYKIYNIDGVEIPFNQDWTKVAISLSGGADSTLLAYLICDLVPKNQIFYLHVISHTRMWKTRPWQHWDSLRIYDWLVKRFPNIIFERHTNFIAPELEYGNIGPSLTDQYGKKVSGDNMEIRGFAEFVCFWNDIPAYYNAVTRNPKNVNFKGVPSRDVDPLFDNQHLQVVKHMGRWAFHPFRFVQKDWIVKQYKRLGLEELFDKTRSCEGEFDHIDYRNYTPGQFVPTCGKCFWCLEREWAIEQNK